MTSKPRSPARLALLTLVALLAPVTSLLLVATLALPGWVGGRGAALASEALGRAVSIGEVHFQPWRLGLVVHDVRIAGPAPGQPALLTLGEVDAALSLRSLLRGHAVVESLSVTRPALRLARVAEGRYDIDDLIERFAAKPGGGEESGTAFAVYNIDVRDGQVLFDDLPVKRRHELTGLHLALPFLSTLASDVRVKVQPQLSGRLNGVAFDARAEALPFADDANARLAFKLDGLDLATLADYVPSSAPLRLTRGRLDLDLSMDFMQRPKQPPSVKLSGKVGLSDLALTQPAGQPLLSVVRLSLPLVDVQPLRRQLRFGDILLEAPVLAWPAQPIGQAAPAATAPTDASASAPAQPWQVSLAGLALKEGRFTPVKGFVLDAIQLKVGAAAWPLKAPTRLDASLQLEQARLSAQARLSPELLEVDAEWAGLEVERLSPWLSLPGGARLTATVSGQAGVRLPDPLADGAGQRAKLALTALKINGAKLSLPGVPRLFALASARLDKASIDPAAHSASFGTLMLDAPRAELAREADGHFNWAPLLAGPATAPAGSPAWTVQGAGLVVERGALRWHDAAVPAGVPPVALAFEPLKLQLGALSWPATAPVPAQIAGQLAALGANDKPIAASGGSITWAGRLGLAPLSATGSLRAQALPLHLFNAYLDPAWGLQLQRAELGLQADVSATEQAGGWAAKMGGDLRLGPLALLQTRSVDGQRVVGEDLLSWQVLQLDGLKLALAPGAPPRLSVKTAQLDDAYARLIVNEQGHFNLRDIRPAGAASTPASASSPASAPAPGPAPEFAAESIRVNRGVVDFSDRFVRPNYSARLSELHGSLGAFSSTGATMAPLTVRGKVAGTGVLEIDGQLRPGAPLAMDVQANANDIELAPLSSYAGKYAGYAIERGKLSARLSYRVEPGGQLVASNQIILNQLTFGDRVESPDATSLPVRFAVALLKDRDGVIDVNLPVSGSLSDPEFSVGGLVWKLILNLVGKALTSPFALFTGSDGGEEAEIAFAPASAELTAAQPLDRIARLLADKADVHLTLTGWADAQTEIPALREQRLAAALKAETAEAAATPELALKRLYQASKLPNKPKNLLGLAKEIPPGEMRGLLMASYAVDDEALRHLAVARAVAVRDALLARGAPNARVFLSAPKLCNGACDTAWRPHVELLLGAH